MKNMTLYKVKHMEKIHIPACEKGIEYGGWREIEYYIAVEDDVDFIDRVKPHLRLLEYLGPVKVFEKEESDGSTTSGA